MVSQDHLSKCPKCGSVFCYKTPLNEAAYSYFCLGCGYTTSDFQKADIVDTEMLEEEMPELYKATKYIDEEGRIWYPSAMNVPEKGTVFLNGKSADTAQWCGIKTRPLTEEESQVLSNKGVKFKSDTSTMQMFGDNFMEALNYVGLLEQ